ncbi:Protein ALTERED XYLOGLUCAN 4-like, partial [Ananas comosus]
MFMKKKTTTSFLLWLLIVISFIWLLSLITTTPLKPQKDDHHNSTEPVMDTCDAYNGTWVRELYNKVVYTNATCPSLPESKNCAKYGKESEFLRWRWKPHGCDDVPRFDPTTFLDVVRGRRMAFVGDSVARNQMDSLLCLLSQVEIPIDVYKDAEDRFRTWHFQSHNFTLTMLWTQFLVEATERDINGSSSGGFDLRLDRIDANWSSKLRRIDSIIISSGHWFFRENYLYKGNKLVGCTFCSAPNVEGLGVTFAVRSAFRTAFKFLRSCDRREKKLLIVLRTFSPAHFENGAWNGGGHCNRTRPFSEEEMMSLSGINWEIRNAQVGEVERLKGSGEKFEVLDVTKAMLMRPDGHPGTHWNNEWMRGYSDCVHWCIPGPVDLWNELLLKVLIQNKTKRV